MLLHDDDMMSKRCLTSRTSLLEHVLIRTWISLASRQHVRTNRWSANRRRQLSEPPLWLREMRCHSWMWVYPHTSWGSSGVVNHDTLLGFAPHLERSTWRAMLLELPQTLPFRRWVCMCNIPTASNIFRRACAWL